MTLTLNIAEHLQFADTKHLPIVQKSDIHYSHLDEFDENQPSGTMIQNKDKKLI